MRLPDQHLSAEELESLGKEGGLSGELGDQLRPARDHAESCPACRRRLEVYPTTGPKLEKLRSPQRAQKGPDCPSIEVWLQLAGGLLPNAEQERYTNHAAQCDHCGPVLQEVVEDFSKPVTEEEETALTALKMPDRQEQPKPARIAPSPSVVGRGWFGLPRWQVATAATLILVAAGFSLYTLGVFNKGDSVAFANDLLAQAYTEQRTIEPRIPGAKYAPMRVERGPGGSHLNKPAALLKSEALISDNIQKYPEDPAWLQAKARADLLDGNYDSAIKTLKRALETQSDSPELLVDLGSAYFVRAKSEDRAIDYGNAIESFGKALAKKPDDTVALFNRALASEQIFAYTEAVDDWEHYLRIDPQGGWSEEAHSRLAAVKEKIQKHNRSQNEPLLKPPEIAGGDVHDTALSSKIDARIEDYLDIATSEWLMNAIDPSISEPERGEARAALSFLASFLKKSRSDLWLTDILVDSERPGMFKAIKSLTNATRAAASGDYESAVEEASRAEGAFRSYGSVSGMLRARFEKVYALDREGKGSLCRREAIPLTAHANRRRYLWLEIQSLSEEATCRSVTGDIDRASKESDEAIQLAKSSNYESIYLRALGNAASLDDLKGDFNKAWNRHVEGLRLYWNGNYTPLRAFLFYSELSFVAEDEEQSYAAVVLAREAVLAIVRAKKNQNREALSRFRWASLAQAAGMEADAREQFEAADQIFSEIERNTSRDKPHVPVAAYRTAGRIMLASLEAQRGKLDESLALLDEARPGLSAIENYGFQLQFYSTSGEVYLRRHEEGPAMGALRSAISIGETGARTIKGDHDRLVWDRQVGRAYRNLVRLLLNDEKAGEALDIWEWYRGLALREGQISNSTWSEYAKEINFDQLHKNPIVPRPPPIANALPQLKNLTVLSYGQMDDGIAIWIFDDRGIASKWMSLNHQETDRIISRFNRECSDPQSDLFVLKSDAHQLYQWLIAPIASHLDPARDLLVEADGSLLTLAFEALVDDTGTYLGSHFAITASPGIEYVNRLRRDDLISPDLPALIVGPPALRGEIAGEFLPIPDATREAETIARRFHKAESLTGIRATAAAVEKSLPRAAVFHFAGHALATAERAGLLLASEETDDHNSVSISLLNASMLNPSLAAHTRLVVLSACSTANANYSRTANPDNLVRSFLRAGVPHVVASRWNVDSRITDRLMEEFYSQLFAGETVGRSLRRVRIDMLTAKETTHPYYWAAFAPFGRS